MLLCILLKAEFVREYAIVLSQLSMFYYTLDLFARVNKPQTQVEMS